MPVLTESIVEEAVLDLVPERVEPSSEGAARAGAFDAAGGVEAGGRRGPAEAGADASWLEPQWPSAAASLREGLSELFTVNRLGLPRPLRRCLTTTNVIDSSHVGVRRQTNRVSRWRSEKMAVRRAAVTFRETEKHYRRITGYGHLWMLKAHLDAEDGRALEETQKVG